MRQEMFDILQTARVREPGTDPLIFTTKLGEEFGELCEILCVKSNDGLTSVCCFVWHLVVAK